MPKKNIPLRLTDQLYRDIAAWAEADFRSVNGQIEYLLSECVKQRKKNGMYVGQEIDAPPKFDIRGFGRNGESEMPEDKEGTQEDG